MRLQAAVIGSRGLLSAMRRARTRLSIVEYFMFSLPVSSDHSRSRVRAIESLIFASHASGTCASALELQCRQGDVRLLNEAISTYFAGVAFIALLG